MSEGSKLLRVLIRVSEKAANIARACRQDQSLFKLLVQEKSDSEKNPRFFQDFKTLADVLIQETIRHDIGIEFPELSPMVQGEESNVFSNTLGETIVVEIGSSVEDTKMLLEKVLDNDSTVASLLADQVHKDVPLSDVNCIGDLPSDFHVETADLGIWIDPIDSTADYINGIEEIHKETGINLSGLQCVTVLIGVYSKTSGLPVMGVVNQPFHSKIDDSNWQGVCYWGSCADDAKYCSPLDTSCNGNVILLSRTEDSTIKAKLEEAGFTLVEAAGAGYKSLNVALGYASAYLLSRGSTYRWDTCAPQALLQSLNGGIVDFKQLHSDEMKNLVYNTASTKYNNENGLIAYRDEMVLQKIQRLLRD